MNATWDILLDFGFQSDVEVYSDRMPGLSFHFGNFKLSASYVLNIRLVEVVLFTGILSTRRSLADVNFEMLREVKSREQCAAWIIWHLDQAAYGSVFIPERDVGWVTEGRENLNSLPWVANMTAYDARPKCTVQRNWLRLALKTLRDILGSLSDEIPVVFDFNGTVLMIQCAGKTVAFPAEGRSWPKQFMIPAGKIRNLPKRLMMETVVVSVWKEQLNIERYAYTGVLEITSVEKPVVNKNS